MFVCAYCSGKENNKYESLVTCSTCKKNVHIHCLKNGTFLGGLLGDVFFDFECQECSPAEQEKISRQKMPWINLIVLTLYNLHHRSEGVSQRGYFHWKIHICNFIDKHWSILCGNSLRKKKKSWMGTVSGTLSHYSPTYFRSGLEELKEQGWWRLSHSLTPQQIMELYSKSQSEKKKSNIPKSVSGPQLKVCEFARMQHAASLSPVHNASSPSVTSSKGNQGTLDDSSLSAYEETSSIELNNLESEHEFATPSSSGHLSTTGSLLGWNSLKMPESMCLQSSVEPNEMFSDCLFTADEENCPDVMDVDMEEVESLDFCYPSSQSFGDFDDFLHPVSNYDVDSTDVQFPPDFDYKSRDEDCTTFVDVDKRAVCDNNTDVRNEHMDGDVDTRVDDDKSEAGEELPDLLEPILKSLFVVRSKDRKCLRPWEHEECKENLEARCIPMSEYEELQLLNQLKRIPNINDLPGPARRLYRKICVRRMKRERNMPLFNLDNAFIFNKYLGKNGSVWKKVTKSRGQAVDDIRILDRFQHVAASAEGISRPRNCSFIFRLMGYTEPTCFYSPYTQRLLKPFIRRDYDSTPLWLKLMQDIQAKANKNVPGWQQLKRYPIDYSYVRPQHIPTINSLCSEFFYPGIDVTECLQYPDFSCVVLYKKLIIGFAFMVPDVGYNETYISFLFTRQEWRRAGIATFMLYHLIQTCMGKDITLHVSATNPALILYQKFGFKVEEFIQDFYDKYLPADSKECKHALFLRLSR